MKKEQASDARCEEDPCRVSGCFSDTQQAHRNKEIEEQDQACTDESQFLSQKCKDEIRVDFWNKAEPALGAFSQPLSNNPTGADGDL